MIKRITLPLNYQSLLSLTTEMFSALVLTAEVIDNSRYTSVEFDVDKTAVLHGFAGYFHTTLYGNVDLSMYYMSQTMYSNILLLRPFLGLPKYGNNIQMPIYGKNIKKSSSPEAIDR